MRYPLVIWQGRQPLNGGKGTLFRVVHRGPPRADRPDDVPWGVEQRLGMSMLKEETWGPVADRLCREAAHALVHAYGLLLSVDPKKLNLEHPLFCELNLAISEGRESRGCDCPKE